MALGDKAGKEAVELAIPVVRELMAKVDRMTAELQAIRELLENKQVVIKLEDRK